MRAPPPAPPGRRKSARRRFANAAGKNKSTTHLSLSLRSNVLLVRKMKKNVREKKRETGIGLNTLKHKRFEKKTGGGEKTTV